MHAATLCFATVLIVFTLSVTNAAQIGISNVSQALGRKNGHTSDISALDNIGQVALKMVEFISSAQDEKVEMARISDFVMALSKAAVYMTNPEIPQLEDMKSEIQKIDGKLENQKKHIDQQSVLLQQKVEESEAKIRLLSKSLNESSLSLTKLLELSKEKKIGFTAYAASTQTLAANTIVKFETVQVNLGSHYDAALGIFTCPLHGLYVISISMRVDSHNNLDVKLMVDGQSKINLYNYNWSNNRYNTVSQTALVECSAGSKMWAQSSAGGKINNGQFTMFSGYLYETISSDMFYSG